MSAVLRAQDGATIPLELHRWRGTIDDAERWLLDRLPDPVLDIGCGPGRVAAALAREGRMALGIDPSPAAHAEATANGAPCLQRSVFGPLPGEGRWGATLLLDGNVGIGGQPVALLRRCAHLVRPGGLVAAEVGAPGATSTSLVVRVEAGPHCGPWFAWATVGADRWAGLAADAGLRPGAVDHVGDRWLAIAERP